MIGGWKRLRIRSKWGGGVAISGVEPQGSATRQLVSDRLVELSVGLDTVHHEFSAFDDTSENLTRIRRHLYKYPGPITACVKQGAR
jgi:hypothetical protein